MRSPTLRRVFVVAGASWLLTLACGRSTIDFGPIPEADAGVGGSTSGSGGTSATGGSGNVSGGGAGGATGGVGGGSGGFAGNCTGIVNECEGCGCEQCPDEYDDCTDTDGCQDIMSCVDQSGCSGVDCYLGPCQQVINQNGGPFGDAANAAQGLGQCRDAEGCPCGAGGSGGSGGVVGTGGSGTGGFNFGGVGNVGGGGGTGPLACFMCVQNQCPAVGECLLDQACRDGAICAFQNCLAGGGGGGGGLNFQCLLGCFNGDFQAGLKAFQAIQCFLQNCSSQCGGSIPGFP